MPDVDIPDQTAATVRDSCSKLQPTKTLSFGPDVDILVRRPAASRGGVGHVGRLQATSLQGAPSVPDVDIPDQTAATVRDSCSKLQPTKTPLLRARRRHTGSRAGCKPGRGWARRPAASRGGVGLRNPLSMVCPSPPSTRMAARGMVSLGCIHRIAVTMRPPVSVLSTEPNPPCSLCVAVVRSTPSAAERSTAGCAASRVVFFDTSLDASPGRGCCAWPSP